MSTTFLQALQDSALSTALGQAHHFVIVLIQMFHVMGLILLLAAVLLINLRLFNIGLTRQSEQQVARLLAPFTWVGLGVTLLSGTLLFLTGPVLYVQNPAFLPKVTLLATALVLQLTLQRRVARVGDARPVLARSRAFAALGLWVATGLLGRAIGFV